MPDAVTHGVVPGGCEVTANGSDLTVNVSSGYVINNNQAAAVAATPFTAASGDTTYDRYDLVVATSSGAVSALTGVASPTPQTPEGGSNVRLGGYYVRAGATSIASADVQDLRSYVQSATPANTMAFTMLSGGQSAADPGSGKFGFDNGGNAGLVAHIYVSYSSPSWPFVSGTYNSLKNWFQPLGDPATTPYHLRVWSRKAPNIISVWRVTAFTGHTTWADLTVSNVSYTHSDAGPLNAFPALSTDSADSIFEFNGKA